MRRAADCKLVAPANARTVHTPASAVESKPDTRLWPGRLCAQCNVTDDSRYYDENDSACLECKGDEVGVATGIAIAFVVLVLLLMLAMARFKPKSSFSVFQRAKVIYEAVNMRAKFKQLIALWQILTRLGETFVVPMPAAVASLYASLDFVSLDIASFGFPLGCLSLGTFANQLAFTIFAPIIVGGGITLCCIFAALPASKLRSPHISGRIAAGLETALPADLFVSFMTFPMVTCSVG